MLRAADGSPRGDPHRDHPAALQAAGEQTVGAFTQSAAVDWRRTRHASTVLVNVKLS